MKKILKFFLLMVTASFPLLAVKAQPLPEQKEVLQSMRLANAYFMNKWPDPGKEIVTNMTRPSHSWTRAVYYEGLMALYTIDPKKEYYDYAVDWGNKHQWTPGNGSSIRNADDQCFMWPGVIYKDTAYFRKMYDLYHYTKTVQGGHGLYNPEEHLWWRDKDFVPPYKEPNGQNCYWSRGNGWVLAALVRVLSLLPQKDPHRPEYLQNYLDMIQALIPLQRADGFWNVSLFDSTHFGGKELSGTALFTYGIAWGIRQGYLDKKAYLPVVAKSWNAMMKESVHENGMLGFVQGTGKEPKDGQPVGYDKIPDFEDYGLGCLLLAGSEVYQLAPPKPAILDESRVPAYEEPDPLVAADGHRVTTAKEWNRSQRSWIYGLFEKNEYGRMPARKAPVSYSIKSVDSTALDGLAIRKEVTIHFSPTDTAAKLNLVLYLPRRGGTAGTGGAAGGRPGGVKAPVFAGYSFEGNASVETSSQWPLKAILSRGYGVATAWYWDVEADRANGWQTGIRSRLSDVLQIEPYEWSAIGAWAWGLERIADYLETDGGVDGHRLIVMGHSRLGKAAVWAGVCDPRWAAVISNESGEGGAALSKREYGETVGIINAKFPWWFVPAYKQYGGNLASLPMDQHMLLSLIAPRPLYVASAEGDQNSDPKGEFLSAVGAGPVYRLFKENGIGVDSMPAAGQPVGEYVRYHIRTGKHDVLLYDWQQYMDFADRWLKKGR